MPLVLTRKLGESIFVGDDIELKVLDIRRNRISLGVHAPLEKKIRPVNAPENDNLPPLRKFRRTKL